MAYTPLARSAEQDAELDAMVAAATPGAVVVLDVDGCLTDTRWRQLHIFAAYAEHSGWTAINRVGVHHFVDRNHLTTLTNAGIDRADAEARLDDLRAFWAERFFDDDHVELDLPMPGAPRFVREVHGRGATVVYLTGRHTSMRAAGERMFRRYGFPLGARAFFMDKADPRTEDHVHKAACFDAIDRVGPVTLAVDNEPINVNLFADRWEAARVVFVDSDCSDRPVTQKPRIRRIQGFLRTSDP